MLEMSLNFFIIGSGYAGICDLGSTMLSGVIDFSYTSAMSVKPKTVPSKTSDPYYEAGVGEGSAALNTGVPTSGANGLIVVLGTSTTATPTISMTPTKSPSTRPTVVPSSQPSRQPTSRPSSQV